MQYLFISITQQKMEERNNNPKKKQGKQLKEYVAGVLEIREVLRNGFVIFYLKFVENQTENSDYSSVRGSPRILQKNSTF